MQMVQYLMHQYPKPKKRHDKGFATSVQFLVTRNIEMQCEHWQIYCIFRCY